MQARERRLVILVLDELERTAQAEMQGQPATKIELCQQVLAVTTHRNKPAPAETHGEHLGDRDRSVRRVRPMPT